MRSNISVMPAKPPHRARQFWGSTLRPSCGRPRARGEAQGRAVGNDVRFRPTPCAPHSFGQALPQQHSPVHSPRPRWPCRGRPFHKGRSTAAGGWAGGAAVECLFMAGGCRSPRLGATHRAGHADVKRRPVEPEAQGSDDHAHESSCAGEAKGGYGERVKQQQCEKGGWCGHGREDGWPPAPAQHMHPPTRTHELGEEHGTGAREGEIAGTEILHTEKGPRNVSSAASGDAEPSRGTAQQASERLPPPPAPRRACIRSEAQATLANTTPQVARPAMTPPASRPAHACSREWSAVGWACGALVAGRQTALHSTAQQAGGSPQR